MEKGKAIKKLLKCEIIERTMIDEKVSSIEISRVEDDV